MFLAIGILLTSAAVERPLPLDRFVFQSDARATVVVFLGVDCPLANLYAPRLRDLARSHSKSPVRFLAVNSNDYDTPAELEALVRMHELGFAFVKDDDGHIADLFGATRSPEAFVVDADRRIRYRGRIDDQYQAGGKNRAEPSRRDLAEAIEEVLAGRPVSVPFARATGCLLSRHQLSSKSAITYRDVAPILQVKCRECHSPGEVGPFPLTSFAQARGHAKTIAEVVEDGRMPPWRAAPLFGRFRNDRRLTEEEKRTIRGWVKSGCPEGTPLGSTSELISTGWKIGSPDAVFAIPSIFQIPAEGVIEYQHFVVDPGFREDKWMAAGEVRPGNRRVVHHCSVFLQPPGADDPEEFFESGSLGSHNLVAFTPGSGPVVFPPGMAKRIPAGWRLHFVIHYTPIGTPAEDRTELGVRFLDTSAVKREVATKLLFDPDLAIPPQAKAHVVEKTWTADRDYLLLSMLPHMHLRGKAFRYTANYPDGTSEILLDVPEYDFNWQHRYELIEPKRLPAGTVLRCRAVYDNSAANPANPDPTATVRAGKQSWDEMFNGYFDIVRADEPLEAQSIGKKQSRALWLAACLGVAFLVARRVRRSV